MQELFQIKTTISNNKYMLNYLTLLYFHLKSKISKTFMLFLFNFYFKKVLLLS